MYLSHEFARCRGCLGALDARAQAGLCGRCWSLLLPLPEERCPVCALAHGWGEPCGDPVAWEWGDALWEYQGGPGALLVPGIKRGERGWLRALLGRVEDAPLPPWARDSDLVVSAPTGRLRRWLRGFDLAEEAGALVASRLGLPFQVALRKPWLSRPQAGQSRARRRRMGPRVALAPGARVAGAGVLLMDDVWTTGTTLFHCARVLAASGARSVAVLTLFRAGRRSGF